jgi:hypothetical protein
MPRVTNPKRSCHAVKTSGSAGVGQRFERTAEIAHTDPARTANEASRKVREAARAPRSA